MLLLGGGCQKSLFEGWLGARLGAWGAICSRRRISDCGHV